MRTLLAAVVFAVAGMATGQGGVGPFEAVLVAGQSAAVPIPSGVGKTPSRIVLSKAGDHLHIAEPKVAVSTR